MYALTSALTHEGQPAVGSDGCGMYASRPRAQRSQTWPRLRRLDAARRRPALASVLRSLAIRIKFCGRRKERKQLLTSEREQLTHARREEASRYSDTIDRTRLFGVRPRCASGAPVIGDVFLPRENQSSMDDRSYVLPSAAMTGCCINSIEIGQHRLSGWYHTCS
jgi:hypothetical protein